MSGKPYTMKEMKDILEYLIKHKAYSEIKGRKMWMDLASSDITNRTWQSLKETFLKRILPDIHNPYYKLSIHQLASFKQGCDIEAKLNNKLEIQCADAVSNTEDNNSKVSDLAEKGIENNEDIPTGEDLEHLDSNARDSTDTLVLENCYQTAEDIKKDLQSPNEDDDKEDEVQPKSLRDLITYSEPLNILQTTIEDFATDEEGSNGEPQMQIVDPEEIVKKSGNNGDNSVVEIIDSNGGEKDKTNQLSLKQDTDTVSLPQENNEKHADTVTEIVEVEIDKNNDSTVLFREDHVSNKTNVTENILINSNNCDHKGKSSEITQNTNTITDSLPNNQEAFQNKVKQSKNHVLSITNQDKNNKRKRANSQNSLQPKESKKRNLCLKKQSISDSDTIALCQDKKKIDPKIIEKKLNKIDEANKSVSNDMSTNISKTTKGSSINASHLENRDVIMTITDNENPCLKSVSLHEEEISYNKKLKSQNEKNETKEQPTNENINDDNEIVLLKSHSDTVSNSSKGQLPSKKGKREVAKQRRDSVIADVFGFSRGGVGKKRKRTVYKHSSRHQTHHISSGSSEWTSDSDSEFISPPRGRKNRQTRKYLKPKPARILSLEQEGGLFVMYGKKIYPIVKDSKIIKNYVTYTPEEEVEQEESFWKLKYVEEKKRTEKLQKLLNEVHEGVEDDVNTVSAVALTEKKISNIKPKEAKQDIPDKKSMETVQSKTEHEEKTVKFKFTKNNEELQLEGHWSHVNPVLVQVMQLLQKDERKDTNIPIVNDTKPISQEHMQKSGQTTPIIPVTIDDEIKEKVDKIESEIFKEIEDRDTKESIKKETLLPGENITKRRGRPRKSSTTNSSTSTSTSPVKRPKLDAEPNKAKKVTETKAKSTSEPRKTRSKSLNESPKDTMTRKSLSRKSKEIGSPNLSKKEVEQVNYKFPSPPSTRKSKKPTKLKTNRYLTSLDCKVHSSPESRSFYSVESTQGPKKSDESMLRKSHRIRKKTSTVPYKRKSLNRYRTNSHPFLSDDITSESSNSYKSSPLKTMTFQNSIITSDNYSTESYRLLMNKNWSQSQNMFQNLEKIVESPNLNELKTIREQIYEDIMLNDVEMQTDCEINFGAFKMPLRDEETTSDVSLPTSPVLSIVENMSISKDLLSSADDFPVNKLQYNNQIILNDFIKSEPDVSMPLMTRECAIETNGQNGKEYHYNLSAITDTPMSETFLNKINKVNIKNPTLTDSIDTKLRDLMLESSKKKLKVDFISDENNNIENTKENVKTKLRKRSSTPRKRKSSRRLTLAMNEPCIEEHTESCSYSRKSCQTAVQHIKDIDINSNFTQNISEPLIRQKKDVIKVKITKPKQKSLNESVADGLTGILKINNSESGVFLHNFNDSMGFIHNHSETCLNAQECMGDSVQLGKDSESFKLLDSTYSSEHILHKHDNIVNNLEYELFSHDAQDGSDLEKVKNPSSTMYHSLKGSLSPQNSLITEDLSNESPVINIENDGKISRSTKWYLLSEDETTNTNFLNINQNLPKSLGCGANLDQIFPITCAVPNLSTITEMSDQIEDTHKKLFNEKKSKNDLNMLN